MEKYVVEIQQNCLLGDIAVVDAVSSIDETIGGITRVVFKEGKVFKILNHNKVFLLPVAGIKKRQKDRQYGLAVLAYDKAMENGHYDAGEIHISRQASTKHHMAGIKKIREDYAI